MNGMLRTASRVGTMITAAGFMMSALLGCSDSETGDGVSAPTGAKNTYVLVHGAFADSSAWDKVVPLLEKDGSEVIALDLPGHGKDTTPVAGATLQSYTDAVVKAIDGASRPVILVGHSMGGAVVSQAAEQRPERVKKLVYLTAFLIDDGQVLQQVLAGDADAKLGEYLVPSSDGSTLSFKEGWVEGAFCQDCSAEDAAAIKAGFHPEPAAPFATPIHVTKEKWGSVPRAYIEARQDRAISPATQESFFAAFPCEPVIPIETGHCPFLTKPVELAEALKSVQ